MDSAAARVPYTACPLCEARDSVEIMVADCSGHPMFNPALPASQRWRQCSSCGHVFVDGYFTPAALAVLFSGTQESQSPGYDIENQRNVWARVVDSVGALRSSLGGRWLDIGFGNGSLLTTAQEFGYEVVGIDLREESVRVVRQFGVEAHLATVEGYKPEAPFDVISMADVLEHMPFPRQGLERVREMLRPDGLLFLSMPNSDSFLWRALNDMGRNPYWAELEHYHNFGRRRLFQLLEETGFAPARYGISERYRACMEVIARKG